MFVSCAEFQHDIPHLITKGWSMNVAQGGLSTRSDHERAVAGPVAEDRTSRFAQILRLRACLRRSTVGEAGSEHLSRSLQAPKR